MRLVHLLIVIGLVACVRTPQHLDIMNQPPVCDLPTPVLTTPVARIPTNVASDPDHATLIGFVADSLGRVLAQGQVLLDPPRHGALSRQFAITDSVGSYVLPKISEGRHEVVFRSIAYVHERRTIDVRNGDVLSMPIRLRFYRCSGY